VLAVSIQHGDHGHQATPSATDVVLVLCTGNAARSVMAGTALATHCRWVRIETAGTLVVEGQPMSWRTRAALCAVGLEPPFHRSRQVTTADLDRATLVVGLAPEHVEYVRRTHPPAAPKTGTLVRLTRTLADTSGSLPSRLASLNLGRADLEPWEEVVDPGGADAGAFVACAREIVDLASTLAAELDRSQETAEQ